MVFVLMCLCPLRTVAKNARNFHELSDKQSWQTRNDHYMESLVWSVFSRIWTEKGNLLVKSPHSLHILLIPTLFKQRMLPLLQLSINQFSQKLLTKFLILYYAFKPLLTNALVIEKPVTRFALLWMIWAKRSEPEKSALWNLFGDENWKNKCTKRPNVNYLLC